MIALNSLENILRNILLVSSLWNIVYGTGYCSTGYTQIGMSCYKYYSIQVAWITAHTNCLTDKADLVSINDNSELKAMRQFLKDHNSGLVCIISTSTLSGISLG